MQVLSFLFLAFVAICAFAVLLIIGGSIYHRIWLWNQNEKSERMWRKAGLK